MFSPRALIQREIHIRALMMLLSAADTVVAPSPLGATDTPLFSLTPATLRNLYSLPSFTNIPRTNNSQGVAAFNNESFLPSDLAQFQKMNGLPSHPVASTHGDAIAQPGAGATAEGDLDVLWLSGVAPTIPTTVWATTGQRYNPSDRRYDNEPFLKWLLNVTGAPDDSVPNIFTISYQDYEDSLSSSFMQRVSDEFGALAVRGITVTTGSGDWGVGCADGSTSGPLKQGMFRADFPSSSPYVLSVGATTFCGNQRCEMQLLALKPSGSPRTF